MDSPKHAGAEVQPLWTPSAVCSTGTHPAFDRDNISSAPIRSQCIPSPATPWGRNVSILRFPDTSKAMWCMQCNEECSHLYTGKTKLPLHKRMAQHRRATTTDQDSAVDLHLKEKGHSYDDHKVRILARGDSWFKRGVKEAIQVKLERPSLNRGEGLRHHLSPTYNAVLRSLRGSAAVIHTFFQVTPMKLPPQEGRQGERSAYGHDSRDHLMGLLFWPNDHLVCLNTWKTPEIELKKLLGW